MASASPEDVAAHVDQVLQHVYAETGATPAQQAQIAPLVQATATDLMQLHGQFHTEHGGNVEFAATAEGRNSFVVTLPVGVAR